MFSKDGCYVIVFNGEIYNFFESCVVLEVEGYVFFIYIDIEVILVFYVKYGKDCLFELNGMFVFVIWDKQEKLLFLVRDCMGKKLFYYIYEEGKLVFVLEIKVLLFVLFVEWEICDDVVYDFFVYQYVFDLKIIFKGVYKCLFVYYMLYKDGEFVCQLYWDVDFSKVSECIEVDFINELWDLIVYCMC